MVRTEDLTALSSLARKPEDEFTRARPITAELSVARHTLPQGPGG